MTDNTTSHISSVYDSQVNATIPFYSEFHRAAIDLALSVNQAPNAWLDTGCGTGNLCMTACQKLPDTAFTLADPSPQMLDIAKEKLRDIPNINFMQSDSQNLDCESNTFDVITAIQCHHYLNRKSRKSAIKNCFRMLNPNGVFITFENILPLSETGVQIALKRWGGFQMARGKSREETENHLKRFNNEYFPITISEHIDLLKEAGFVSVEILWASYMQAGFYAIKPFDVKIPLAPNTVIARLF